MLKGADLSAIFAGIIIVIGISFVVPHYYQSYYQKYYQHQDQDQDSQDGATSNSKILLAFGINSNDNMPNWCNDLSSLLIKFDLEATVFFSGNIAEKYPDCVKLFSVNNDKIDVGSQTYSYINLSSISNYSRQLNEVTEGKVALDGAGNINSTLFKAPYGSTNENIYSLLRSSGILADFSYTNQYNKFEDGEFIKYDLITYHGSLNASVLLNNVSFAKANPVAVNFNNSIPINKIEAFLSEIRPGNDTFQFVNASEIIGINLNTRR
jgi:polysaccharide deacetylase